MMIAKSAYFICGTNRTGSTLLSDLLTKTGLAGEPAEYFNHGESSTQPIVELDFADYGVYIAGVLKEHTTANGVFGSKLMGGTLPFFERRLRGIPEYAEQSLTQILSSVFPNPKYIWLTRRNKIRQAVSWWMAIQTGIWHRTADTPPSSTLSPEYKFEAIDHLLQEVVVREARLAEMFSQAEVVPLYLVYEDMIQDMEGSVRNVLNFIGVNVPANYNFTPPSLQRTANALSEEWVQRYREEKQSDWWMRFW